MFRLFIQAAIRFKMQQVIYIESLNYYTQPDDGLYEKSKHVAKVFKCTRCAPLLFLIHKMLNEMSNEMDNTYFTYSVV